MAPARRRSQRMSTRTKSPADSKRYIERVMKLLDLG
jgi:hypothetical protein